MKDGNFKVAPNSKESEMMVLGCMISNPSSLQYAAEELELLDFYYSEHKPIFQTLKVAFHNRKQVDIHLLCEELKQQEQLKAVGGAAYITSLAQYAGTSAYIEEYVEQLKEKSLLRNIIAQSQSIEKLALESDDNGISILEKYQHSLKEIQNRFNKKPTLLNVEKRIEQLESLRKSFQGKKYLGLCVKSIEEFNEKLLGLRKLTLLAAAPNVGKTALTIQLALEVLLTEPEACLAYFSLEMTSVEIFTRMGLFLSEMSFNNFIFGSRKQVNEGALYTEDEFKRINNAFKTLKGIGNRLQIIDTLSHPYIDARSVINYVETLKAQTKCKRAIVIIDYLQVWPTNPSLRFPSENEADKWRIGEMKKIRDAMNDDPVIVISEARKPSGANEIWGGELSDVMGSARGTYTPDVVMLLSQIKPKALAKMWERNNMPKNHIMDQEIECSEDERLGMSIKNFLAKNGVAICKLDVPKARDGMQKFSVLLEFHFQINTFKKLDWSKLRALFDMEGIKSRKLNFG